MIGDELGVAGEQRVQDAQAVAVQRGAGLGEVDDRVDDVGHLGLGRTVGRDHDRLNPARFQVPAGQRRELGRDPDTFWHVGRRLPGHGSGDGEYDADGIGRCLGVLQLAKRGDIRAGLGDPVPARDAEVEEPLLDVGRYLLRPQEAHPLDPRVIDHRVIVAVR